MHRASSGPPLHRLIASELGWVLRRSVRRGKLAAAIVVAVASIAAFGPLTPGLVLSQGWRLAVGLVLGMVAAVIAHGLLQRSSRREHDDDPLPALRAVLAATVLLVTGTIALAYLLRP
jgi:MFS family permease